MRTAEALARARQRGERALVVPVPLSSDTAFDAEACARLVLAGADVLELRGPFERALRVAQELAGAPAAVVVTLERADSTHATALRGLDAGVLVRALPAFAADVSVGVGEGAPPPELLDAATGYLRFETPLSTPREHARAVALRGTRPVGVVVPSAGLSAAQAKAAAQPVDGVALEGFFAVVTRGGSDFGHVEAALTPYREAVRYDDGGAGEACSLVGLGRR